ncbi:MAG TPA: glycosyltransferase family 2 protein [Puia sp.]|nr:glycosyltransferase family 2 protein [Puia sp.]
MAQPLISIITVVYNGAATFERTIRSVIGQTYSPFEYIIVDGGSKDGTQAIIDTYKEHIAKYVSEPDKGVYDAMNKGIGMASGEWLFFLGADDILYDDEVLASVARALAVPASPEQTPPSSGPATAPPDLLYGNVVSDSYNGPYDGEFTFEKLLSQNISHQAIFYKKDLFDLVGNYNLRYKAYADWDLNIRCFADNRIRTKFVDRVIAEFGADGISSRHDVPFLREVLIPQKLTLLAQTGTRRLRSLPIYDEWWRLIRNAGIRKEEDLDELARPQRPGGPASALRPSAAEPVQSGESARGGTIPRCLQRMARWQSRIPPPTLQKGVLSKSLMFASYLINLLTGSL